MTTDDLISYIKKQTASNLPKNFIISKLLEVGWRQEDIDEAFNLVEQETKVIKNETPNIVVNKPEIITPKEDIQKVEQSPSYEFIPSLIPKDTIIPQTEPTFTPDPSTTTTPKDALLKSYYQDVANSQSIDGIKNFQDITNQPAKPAHKSYKKWIILSVITVIVLGVAYAFASGLISLKNINFSFIKKDPRVLLLNNSGTLASLKSYKTETEINITSPTIADISSALVSGEEVSSIDKDSLTINNIGIINQTDGNFKSDNFLTIKSSLLTNIISTDIKSDSQNLYISLPDAGLVTGFDAVLAMVVKTNDENSHLISNIFPQDVGDKLSRLNFYRILSKSVSSYVDENTITLYNQFISDSTIIEKGEENIKGIDTYHYNINTDQQVTKKLLTKIFDNFTVNLSDADKIEMEDIVGSTKINSFDVWIGKTDNNIYQYKVVLNIPLSKILKFEDKSIGDNTVNISWQTTYYDFGVENSITMPEQSTDITEFLKIINEIRFKKEISGLKDYATMLKNIEGVYGVGANTSGSCTKPTYGSLFSPTGHPKKAIDSISSISSLMNQVLTKTNNQGACYSTTKSWSFTVPMSDNYSSDTTSFSSFYCIDSTGVSKDLQSYPKGPVCQ